MTIIGNFTKQDGEFRGKLETLITNRPLEIRAVERKSDHGPDYRIYAGDVEIGAGWLKSREGKQTYLSLTLDDPSFAKPVHGRLVRQGDGAYRLYWSR